MNRQTVGRFGEWMAGEWMKRKGYNILERNYRCPYGEIDIVAGKGRTLVFVEVKTRQDTLYGMPAEAVTAEKRRHMGKAARWYLREKRIHGADVRLDVMEVLLHHIEGVEPC